MGLEHIASLVGRGQAHASEKRKRTARFAGSADAKHLLGTLLRCVDLDDKLRVSVFDTEQELERTILALEQLRELVVEVALVLGEVEVVGVEAKGLLELARRLRRGVVRARWHCRGLSMMSFACIHLIIRVHRSVKARSLKISKIVIAGVPV